MVQFALVLTFVLATILAAPAGWWLGGCRRMVWVPLAVLGLAGTITFPIIARRPDLLLELYPSREFAAIDPVWFVPFAVGFLGIAARQVDRRTTRLATSALSVCLMLLGVGSSLWVACDGELELRDLADAEGVVRQSTYYTCGAAATATLCRRLGIEATETEMARRTGVVPGCGTTMVKVYWALKDKLAGAVDDVRLMYVPELAPGLVPTPCVADLRLSLGLNHLVLVREVSDSAMVIEDPFEGLQRVPIADARARWSGSIVAVMTRTPILPVDADLRARAVLAGPAAAPSVDEGVDVGPLGWTPLSSSRPK